MTFMYGDRVRSGGRLGVYEGIHPIHDGALVRFDGDGGQSLTRLSELEHVGKGVVTMGEERMLQFFQASHLPTGLREVSQPFCDLAYQMCDVLPGGPERTVMLRKLLEAKDCAVRARLEQQS